MDKLECLILAELALEGLSIGDGFGECFFTDIELVRGRIAGRHEPPGPWFITDDSIMATGIFNCLKRDREIIQDNLANEFAKNYMTDTDRGYGGGAMQLLWKIHRGGNWKEISSSMFGGSGSMGNGAAMRVAPLGAYFHHDLDKVKEQAILSAEVTHYNDEGRAGAVAVAIATAIACRLKSAKLKLTPTEFIEYVLEYTPPSTTHNKIAKSLTLPTMANSNHAAAVLGNGATILMQDTVPFVIWAAAQYINNFEEALWMTVSALGDCDTTCAMVGGIVCCALGQESIPKNWVNLREDLGKFKI